MKASLSPSLLLLVLSLGILGAVHAIQPTRTVTRIPPNHAAAAPGTCPQPSCNLQSGMGCNAVGNCSLCVPATPPNKGDTSIGTSSATKCVSPVQCGGACEYADQCRGNSVPPPGGGPFCELCKNGICQAWPSCNVKGGCTKDSDCAPEGSCSFCVEGMCVLGRNCNTTCTTDKDCGGLENGGCYGCFNGYCSAPSCGSTGACDGGAADIHQVGSTMTAVSSPPPETCNRNYCSCRMGRFCTPFDVPASVLAARYAERDIEWKPEDAAWRRRHTVDAAADV